MQLSIRLRSNWLAVLCAGANLAGVSDVDAEPKVPPTITGQPQSLGVTSGGVASFGVTASGTSPLYYQWRKNGVSVPGATGTSYRLTAVTTNDAGGYDVVVNNAYGTATSSGATLTVYVPPWFTVQPNSLVVTNGNNAVFAAGAQGIPTPMLQWYFGASPLAGENASLLSLTDVQPADAGSYYCVASNAGGTATSGVATLTVLSPPTISDQPESQVRLAGTAATFTAAASGTAPLSYQWQRDGVGLVNDGRISGATSSTLVIADLQPADAGGYRVRVINGLGQETSEVATLTVLLPGDCASAPSGLVAWWGGDGTASDLAGENAGVLQGGATASAVGLMGSAFGFDGTNSCVEIPDAPALKPTNLTVEAWVRFSSLDSAGNASVGQQYIVFKQNNRTYSFEGYDLGKVRVGGHDQFVFRTTSSGGVVAEAFSTTVVTTGVWYHVAGVRGSDFLHLYVNGQLQSQTNVGFAQDYGARPLYLGSSGQAYWDRKFSGVLDEVSLYNRALAPMEVSMLYLVHAAGKCKAPIIREQPQSQGRVAGASASFSVTAMGFGTLHYQWQCNGEDLPGAMGARLELSNVQPAHAGSYSVVVTNTLGAVTSQVATLTVWVPPVITEQPQSRTNLPGTEALFSAAAVGTHPLSYQWQFNGLAVSGATAPELLLTNLQPNDAGSYTVVVTNMAGSAISEVAVLMIAAPPVIAAQPRSLTNAVGAAATFSVTAAGSGPFGYQWQWNGISLADEGRISGAASSSLQIADVQTGDAGDYRVVVSNADGAVTSLTATLSVFSPPAVIGPPESLTADIGANATFSVTASGTPPLGYQWRFNGLNIPAATGTALRLTNVQPTDAGSYSVVVTNLVGAATSAVATLTVLVPPAITLQPASLKVTIGMDASFSVTASGTPPPSYQWMFDGAVLAGATDSTLVITNAQLADAGAYTVLVSNLVGSVTSAVANLTVVPPSQPPSQSAGALVLVNSQSAKYLDFQHFIQPYLENFGFPYSVQDISTNTPGATLTNYAVIIIGHSQLDTNFTYLNTWAQASICLAISNGTGLVNFDNDLSSAGAPRYLFVQDIFGFSYGAGASGTNVSFSPTEPASQMHYITARHLTNDLVPLRSSLAMPGITVPAAGKALAWCGGKPLVAISRYGQGRAVQWGSYGWMVSTVLGPVDGLDDLVWRGVVWAARKPFVMRGLPHLVTMRVDDAKGPFDWIHQANAVGFKPFVTVFMSNIVGTIAADLGSLTTSGKATASIHSFDCCNRFFYFNHAAKTPNSDLVQSNNFYLGTQWHLSNGIPISKICAPHYSEIGSNCFPWLKAWGVEFVPIEVVPETLEYETPGANWLAAGPYRLYETPRPGRLALPTYYADWLSVPGHREFDGQFFDAYSEPRDATSCGEWCPDNDVAGSISRAVRIARRGLDSMVLCTIYGHEYDFYPVAAGNWPVIFQGITNGLASYDPVYVTLDYACQYVRAMRTSRLVSSAYDPESGEVTASFAGRTDLDTQVHVFTGHDDSITNKVGLVPMFSESDTNALVVFGPPAILSGPASQTNYAGATAVFNVEVRGAWPLSYQWYQNETNALSDSDTVTGASGAALIISNVLAEYAGSYSVVVANSSGTAVSPAAILTVVDYPALLSAPIATNGDFSFTLSGKPGQVYELEVSTNLYQWELLAWLTNFTGQVYFTAPASSNSPSRFYRARVP